MSLASLKGNASGTGTVTLESPNTNSDLTLSLPSRSGNIAMDGPTFSAIKSSNQTGLSSATFTKVTFDTKEWDTATCYSTSTSRFTPNVAGYYLVTSELDVYSNTALVFCSVYKNGSEWKRGYGNNGSNTETYTGVSTQVYCNGTTDYLEIYVYAVGGTPAVASGTMYCWFQALLVRAA